YTNYLDTLRLVVQFSMSGAAPRGDHPSRGSLTIISQRYIGCQYLFFGFLNFFLSFFRRIFTDDNSAQKSLKNTTAGVVLSVDKTEFFL
ncbi:MAG: hypothetical protein IJK58_08380, partial [Clostridia bacterium]|nr:hypothetical protein [Clostridia bacterium]